MLIFAHIDAVFSLRAAEIDSGTGMFLLSKFMVYSHLLIG
jgi:hypothetical protein